jgi:hypothetical protein
LENIDKVYIVIGIFVYFVAAVFIIGGILMKKHPARMAKRFNENFPPYTERHIKYVFAVGPLCIALGTLFLLHKTISPIISSIGFLVTVLIVIGVDQYNAAKEQNEKGE